MGNALEEVKREADVVIGSNDEDGIAIYLEEIILTNEFNCRKVPMSCRS